MKAKACVDATVSSILEYEKQCPICLEKLTKSEHNHKLKNSSIYQEGLFKCPRERLRFYCYKCIKIWSNQFTAENPDAAVPCPFFRLDLNKNIKIYRENYIKKFLKDPKEK